MSRFLMMQTQEPCQTFVYFVFCVERTPWKDIDSPFKVNKYQSVKLVHYFYTKIWMISSDILSMVTFYMLKYTFYYRNGNYNIKKFR